MMYNVLSLNVARGYRELLDGERGGGSNYTAITPLSYYIIDL